MCGFMCADPALRKVIVEKLDSMSLKMTDENLLRIC